MHLNGDTSRNLKIVSHGGPFVGSVDVHDLCPEVGETVVIEGGGKKYTFKAAAVEVIKTVVIRRIQLEGGVEG